MSGFSADGPNGEALWARADAVLPGGGIYWSRSADMAGRGVLPGFIASANGCRVTDVDGRDYIDFLCANGPNLLGYRHPAVEAAVSQQRERLVSGSLFPPSLVDLVETLVARFPPMGWGLVSKNGSEVVALALRTARQQRQRRRICTFSRAYHGNDPELASAPPAGVLDEGTEHIDRVPWNDPQRLLDHCRRQGDATAALLLNPLDQNPGMPTETLTSDQRAAIVEARERWGLLLIVDSVRHGFRLHPDGCHRFLDLEPDLITLGKALGNGYSVSALLGLEALRPAARKILYTSTYMFESPPMRAALAVLELYDRERVFEHLVAMGERLATGFREAAAEHDQAIAYTGPVTMPSLRFEDDDRTLEKGRRFSRAMAERGVLWHPLLNHFLSFAHQRDDIDQAVAAARESFASLSGT